MSVTEAAFCWWSVHISQHVHVQITVRLPLILSRMSSCLNFNALLTTSHGIPIRVCPRFRHQLTTPVCSSLSKPGGEKKLPMYSLRTTPFYSPVHPSHCRMCRCHRLCCILPVLLQVNSHTVYILSCRRVCKCSVRHRNGHY